MARDEFAVIDAPRLANVNAGPNDRVRSIEKTRRQASRVRRMETEGWITRAEGAALERYELLIEQAGYGGGRSCLDMSRGGGSPEGIVDALAAARRLLAMAQNAVSVHPGGEVALIFVNAVLSPYGAETADDVTDRLCGGARTPRSQRREMAREYCAQVGAALAIFFRMGI